MPKTSADVAFINPEILTWAIKASGQSKTLVASKVKVDPEQIASWEAGIPPPFAKAQDLAKALHLPFGYLFLPEVPAEDLPIPDFRTLGHGYHPPSVEFLQLLNEVLVRQDWYRDHLRESSPRLAKLKFIGSFTSKDKVTDVATSIRNTLGLTADLRSGVGSWSEYLSTITRHAETGGILVMRSSIVGNTTQYKISPKEVQGFAVTDPYAPVVFVNSADYKAAQIFTLIHELAHLWINQSAITNPDPLKPSANPVEAFCNRVAATALVPQGEFLNGWEASERGATRISALARRFWVSTLVVLRRAHDLDLLSDIEFHQLRSAELKKISDGKKSSGGDYYRNVTARMGARFTNAVLGEVNRKALLLTHGAQLLSLSVPTLAKFAEMSR
ncbi:MAG: ImmA/IrrE family metallo-endopeptidase [Acidobacteriota bacterium]